MKESVSFISSFKGAPHRRRALGLLLLAVMLVIGDRCGAWLLDRLTRRSEQRFARLYRGAIHEPAVIVLGSSRGVNAIHAVDARERTGVNFLNLSYNGMSMEIAEAVLRDYLDRNAQPAMVVLEASNLNLPNNLLADLKLYSHASPHLRDLLRRDQPTVYRASRLMRLYTFNSELFLRTLYYLNRSDQSWANVRQITQAYAETYEVAARDAALLASLRPRNIEALERILERCAAEGIPVRLLVAPYLPRHRQGLHEFATWLATVRATTEPFGVWLHDYSQAVIEAKYFADATHLNREGSDRLLDALLADGLFAKQKPDDGQP